VISYSRGIVPGCSLGDMSERFSATRCSREKLRRSLLDERSSGTMRNRLDAYRAAFEATVYREASTGRLKAIPSNRRDRPADNGFFVGPNETRSPPASSSPLRGQLGVTFPSPRRPRNGIHDHGLVSDFFCGCTEHAGTPTSNRKYIYSC
jgi:hypothetical protein